MHVPSTSHGARSLPLETGAMDLPKFVSTRTKPLATVQRVAVPPDPNPSVKLPLLVLPKETPNSLTLTSQRDTAFSSHSSVLVPAADDSRQDRVAIAQFSHGAMTARLPAPPEATAFGESQAHHRMRVLENRVSAKKVNPIAAWPCVSLETKDKGQLTNVAARSPLALELEKFIRKEHRQLLLHCPGASRLQAIPIYREAWGCIINNFPEYSAVMSLIRQEYDGVMEELQVQSEKALRMDRENRDMKGVHNMQLIQDREQMEHHLMEKKIQLEAAIKANVAARQQYSQLEILMEQQKYDHQVVVRELADAHERVRLLSTTVVDEGSKSAKYFQQLKEKKHENEQLGVLVHSLKTTLAEAEKQVDQLQRAFSAAQERIVDVSSGGLGESQLITKKASMRKRNSNTSSTVATASTVSRVSSTVGVSGSPTASAPKATAPQTPLFNLSAPLGAAAAYESPPSEQYRAQRRSVDVIGDATSEGMRQMIFELECKVEGLEHECNMLRKHKTQLEEKLSVMKKELNRDVMTPRPDWSAAAARLKGLDVSKENSSKTKLTEIVSFFEEKLSEELRANERASYGKIISDWLGAENISVLELIPRSKYFYPKGRGPSVPVYLRSGKLIRDRRLQKGDVEKILKRFWDSRKIRMSGTIEEFWWQWLIGETGSQPAAVELAYNVMNVCEANMRDPDCSTFMRVIQGEVSEQLIWDQQTVLKLMNELFEERRVEGTRSEIHRFELEKVLREVFPEKSIDNMRQLRFVLSIWAKGRNIIDFVALQSEDSDGNQSRFMEMLRDQYVDEVSHFNLEVIEAIRSTMMERQATTILIEDAVQAVLKLDPQLSEMYVFDRFSFACRIAVSELMAARETQAVDGETFLQRLRTSVLFKRCTPVDIDELFVPSEADEEEQVTCEEEELQEDGEAGSQ